MRVPSTVAIGALLAVVGVIGLTFVFPNFMATNGQEFVDQIDISSGLEKYGDYTVGDEVVIVDKIARMEYNDGQTHIWLDSIGKSQNDPPFRFGSNLMSDYGVGNQIIITFEVVSDSSGHDVPAGYQNEGNGLSTDAINSRYSTVNEYIFIALLVAGLGIMVYGGYSSFRGGSSIGSLRPAVMTVDDDWGLQAPPMTSAAPAPAPAPPQPMDFQSSNNPLSTAAIPQPAPASPPAQPIAPPVSAPATMTITVPPGVIAGQVLTVTMPNGQVVNVQVPPGCSPGSQFTITVNQ
ncbi:MAG: hypothetical protein VX898_04095 [Candidatus Thermoplasmatota archaeon]|nr:hypothetical protein [Candidatus Thermoplasmatota archaeon]